MNILITGAGGMIGSHLADFLIAKGHRVTGFDFVPTTDIRELNKNMDYVECDIRDHEKVKNLLQKVKPEIIFHSSLKNSFCSWVRSSSLGSSSF